MPHSVEALRKLGFERVEQLIGTPRGPLAKRFGRTCSRSGSTRRSASSPSRSSRFSPRCRAARRGLLEPIVTAEAFAHVIGDLAPILPASCAALGKGARRLDCYFHRVDGETQAIRVGTASPSRDPRHLAKLLAARIETIEPGLGIEAMTLVAPLVEPLAPEQRAGLEASAGAAPTLRALVDALANRFGQRACTAPARGERDARALGRAGPAMSQGSAGLGRRPAAPDPHAAPPRAIDVTAMLPDHPPAMFVWRGKRFRVRRPTAPNASTANGGARPASRPSAALCVRDYFQVEVDRGRPLLAFPPRRRREPSDRPMRWFIHGAFA
jgi:protein ImuB